MKITQEADYGLRVIMFLSKKGYGIKVDAKTISDSEVIPLRFLLKLLRKLINVGMIKSYRGVNGGYALDKLPQDITFLDVIEAIDGPICINRCVYDLEYCNAKKGNRCLIHKALTRVQKNLIKELRSINFKIAVEDNKFLL